MNGAHNIVGHWQDEGDGNVVGAEGIASVVDTDEAEAPMPRDRLPWIVGIAAILAAAGWIAVVALTHAASFADGIALADIVAAIRDASAPLVLIAVAYAALVRVSRSEGARLTAVTGKLRAEQSRLDSAMTSVAERIDSQRIELAAQSDQLMALGEEAASRLHAVAQKLKGDIDEASREAKILQSASQAARADMTALLADLPRAQSQTMAMTTAIDQAGLLAHERAGALDSQIATLVARGREADEVAGGAAQKLAAHLARVEGVSESAGAQLSAAAETMTAAIDAALGRAATAGGVARQAMDAQAAAMVALVDQSEAALSRTGNDASEAIAVRVAEVTQKLEVLGAMLTDHEATSTKLLYGISSGIDAVDERFAAIDVSASTRHAQLTATLGALATQAQTLTASLDTGGLSAETMIGKTETLMTALDATTREIEETLPGAFGRLDSRIDASRVKIAEVAPEVARIEREASAALDRLLAAEKLLTDQRAALDALGTALDARLKASAAAASDLVAAVEGADARANAIAQGAGTTLVETMVRVREAAQTAADRAKEALAAVVPDSADRLSIAVKKALGDAVSGQVDAQIGELAAAAERAMGSANAASDRLMRQMLTIAETSAQVESRIAEARTEIDDADRDNFSRRVALLIESLNSTAIDVTKIMSNDITDSAWNAYLKGDRGVFTRRAVRLLDAGEAREIVRHYNDDPEFRDQVNRYVHDFEAMLRNVLATRAGSPLGVTLLSSDMGKLYVALAQAIERLRT